MVNPDKLHDLICDYIDERLQSKIKGPVYVIYSAYRLDRKNVPILNLDDIAFKGTTKFYAKSDPSFGNGTDYESKEVSNLTWLDVVKLANDMIKTTGDKHHVFLEDIERRNGKTFFVMGS